MSNSAKIRTTAKLLMTLNAILRTKLKAWSLNGTLSQEIGSRNKTKILRTEFKTLLRLNKSFAKRWNK